MFLGRPNGPAAPTCVARTCLHPRAFLPAPVGNAGTGAVTRVQAGDVGGGLEIALDCVFDYKYLYKDKEVIFQHSQTSLRRVQARV